MNFLNTSLDNLVNNLKNSKYDFPCLKKHCKYIKNDTDLDLLTKKGTYPYEYMDCVEKFNDTGLPKHEEFYSKVSGKIYLKKNMNMHNIYGIILILKQWVNTMICIYNWMYCY